LAPHFKEIREDWHRSLRTLKLEMDDIQELSHLTLESQYDNLRSAKLDAFNLALERCGQSLDRRGLPPVYASIALSFYLDACCARIVDLGIREAELLAALVRLNSAALRAIIAGYTKQHWSSWWKMAEQERRRFSQDLHDEIGHNLVVLKLYLELMSMD